MATNKKSSKPSKFVQPQKQVIETPPDFKAAYANVVYTTVTEHDFTLTFGRVTGPRKALASRRPERAAYSKTAPGPPRGRRSNAET